MADIAKLAYIAGELQRKAGSFTNAAEALRQQATRLDWAAQGLAGGSWAGQGSQAFQKAWNLYHRDTQRAASTLDDTASTLITLANRLDEQVQAMHHAQQLSALGLVSAATVATAAAEVAIFSADAETGSVFDEIAGGVLVSNELITLLENPGTQSFIEALDPTLAYTSDDNKLGFSIGDSVWSKEAKQHLGSFDGAPVNNTFTVGLGNGRFGAGIQPGNHGETDAAIEGEISLLNITDNVSMGSKDLGLTAGSETKVLDAQGDFGWYDNSLGARVGVTWISETGSVGANIDGVNVGIDGTIGLKAEFGLEIGEKTELRLPFFSFGFSIGKAQ